MTGGGAHIVRHLNEANCCANGELLQLTLMDESRAHFSSPAETPRRKQIAADKLD